VYVCEAELRLLIRHQPDEGYLIANFAILRSPGVQEMCRPSAKIQSSDLESDARDSLQLSTNRKMQHVDPTIAVKIHHARCFLMTRRTSCRRVLSCSFPLS